MHKQGNWAMLLVLVGYVACTGAGGGSKQRVVEPPTIEVNPPEREVIIPVGLSPGSKWEYQVCVLNQATGSELLVSSITLDPPVLCEGDDPQTFYLIIPEDVALPVGLVGPGAGSVTGKLEKLCITVNYIVQSKECERSATLHIKSNTSEPQQRDYTITFKTEVPVPHIVVVPQKVDFGMLMEGQTAESYFVIRNTGLAVLEITKVSYWASKNGFAVKWRCKWKDEEGADEEGQKWVMLAEKPSGEIGESLCEEPLTVPGNGEYRVRLKYGATDEEEARATLTIYSNDPLYAGKGIEVELRANMSGPCLRATPEAADFGTVIKGSFHAIPIELQSCGDQEVQVTSIALDAGAASPFKLDFQNLPEPTEEKPLVFVPGERKSIVVTYLPVEAKKDADGKPIPDSDVLRIKNTSYRPEILVPLSGTAVEGTKPVCDFRMVSKKEGKEVEDGGSVLVLDTLTFYDQSYDPMPGGKIVAWEWSAETPPGSADVFQPSYKFPTPTFEVNVVGDYLFCLKVFNVLGISSDQCCKLVHVRAGEGCVVELTWETPNDPDPTDQCGTGKHCGSDMDLHVVHRYASSPDIDKDGKPDGFFDKRWDCFWFNPRPMWVEGGDPVLDQPSLDRDDTDGAGPENFRYYRSPPGECYKVGVHYWDDHTFGQSYATVRVYIDGDLRYEKKSPKMVMLDMWEVGEVCCSDKQKPFIEYQVGGAPVIIHNYVNPEFNFNP